MSDDIKKYINDYANGKIVDKKYYLDVIVLSIIALSLFIPAIVLLINLYC